MQRDLQVGDFVSFEFAAIEHYYQVESVSPSEITIIKVLNPNLRRTLIFGNGWEVLGSDIPFMLRFYSREEFFSFLDGLGEEVYDFPIEEIEAFCRLSERLNYELCQQDSFWCRKYIRDFGGLIELGPDCKEKYKRGNVYGFGNGDDGRLDLGPYRIDEPMRIFERKFKKVSAGGRHSIFITSDNSVWVIGDNEYGQLGQGFHHKGSNSFTPMPIGIKAKDVSAGYDFTVILDTESNVWTFGNNLYGQLGLGKTGMGTEQDSPREIGIKAKAISAGRRHVLLIDLNDNVWVFGNNEKGQLGLGRHDFRNTVSTPTQVPGPLRAKTISAGGHHSIVIDPEDNVFVFGFNLYGELGLGDKKIRDTPTQIPEIKAKRISAGNSHTVLIDSDDNVLTFGSNLTGALGRGYFGNNGTENKPLLIGMKAKDVSAGDLFTVVLDTEDNVWTFGKNLYGNLGLGFSGKVTHQSKPMFINFSARQISAGWNHTLLLT